MDFKYINYGQDEFENIINEKNRVYITDSNINKTFLKNYEKKEILKKSNLFFTLNELKENIFLDDKITLKEEKEFLLFYEILNSEEKKALNISTYYDSIDIAGEFINFFTELNEYNVDKIDNLNIWQTKRYSMFSIIKKRYEEELNKRGYTLPMFKYNIKNIDLNILKDYDEICFVNVLNFTPLEKEIITLLEKNRKKVIIYNQIYKEDYNEKELKIKDITFPKKIDTDIKIYENKEEFLEILNSIKIAESGKYDIYDLNFENSKYKNIFLNEHINFQKVIEYSSTKIFKYLDGLHTLLNNLKREEGKYLFRLKDILEAVEFKEIKYNFQIEDDDIMLLRNMAVKGYKFIDKNVNIPNKIKLMLLEIEEISKFKTLKEFCDYIEKVDVERTSEENKLLFEALSEIAVIEKLDIVSSWDNYFEDIAEGLFRLVLKYLRFKKVSENIKLDEDAILIKNYQDIKFINENMILLNCNDNLLPTKYNKSFLLTEKQRKNLGLKNYEDNRLIEKHKFLSRISNSNETIIFAINNENKNVDASSFVEELIINYNIKKADSNIDENNYEEVISSIFKNGDGFELINNNFKLKLEKNDFEDNKFIISPTDLYDLNMCNYKFYLKKIANLTDINIDIEYKLDSRTLGIILHKLMEEIGFKVWGKKIKVEKKIIRENLNKILKEYELFMPKEFERYYTEVLFENIIESVFRFFDKLNKILEKESNIKYKREENTGMIKLFDEKDIEVSAKGRIDLLVETENSRYLIDYKTGNGKFQQLDFYSILFYGDAGKAEKYLYNVMESRFILEKERKKDDKPLTKLDLEETIKGMIREKEYIRKKNLFVCNDCEYGNICRMRWEENE
ncbi:PD-(D/E)XK nuclease family protein [Haliovirga abyssi]|uniref:PD-(D/E)XK endonuclease-like domain-containing protein n=1 Tax=Haliovirga abyssi TaxID=2996794 RepID=A0AAU9E0V6_9FUSO|nr:PD-(D/E)XK nuclease family protein [Haliovirga abyssi]BDU51560.1 hypothetical protein HLVA_21290 [Haliovirga abyssi]